MRPSVTGPGVTMKFPKRFKFLFKFNCHHKHLHFVFKYDERTIYMKVYEKMVRWLPFTRFHLAKPIFVLQLLLPPPAAV